MKSYKRISRKAGVGTPSVMLFMVGVSVVGVSMMSLTSGIDKNGDRSVEVASAKVLAESGIEALYDQVRTDLRATNGYPFTLPQKTVTLDGKTFGRYSARVVNAQISVADIPEGTGKYRRTTYTFELEGLGQTETTLATAKLRAKFTGTIEQNLQKITTTTQTGSSAGKIFFPSAAVATQGMLSFISDGQFKTVASDGKSGHVLANQGISWTPPGGKVGVTGRPINVQGAIATYKDAYDYTVGPMGLGNPNGSVNFSTPLSAVMGLLATPVADTVVRLTNPVNFADDATVTTWESNWLNTAKKPTATRYNGTLAATSLTTTTLATAVAVADAVEDADGNPTDGQILSRVLRAPAHITGDLDLGSLDVLRLLPTSSNPAENVIYVDGDVKNAGRLLNLGVKIIVKGRYLDQPGAKYEVSAAGSPLGSRSSVLNNAALISTSNANPSISFSTNYSATTGLVYATRGGIDITSSNVEFSGVMIGTKGISIKPKGGGDVTFRFEKDAASPGAFTGNITTAVDTTYTPSGIRTPFTPNRIKEWSELVAPRYRRDANGNIISVP